MASISTPPAPPHATRPATAARKPGTFGRIVRACLVLTALIGGLGGLLAAGILPRIERAKALASLAHDRRDHLPMITTATVRRATAPGDLVLPGNIQAFQETGIQARTDGYLRERKVDIGDHVDGGQLLAEIDTPEVDQQLKEAEATFLQAQANEKLAEARQELARTNFRRTQLLAGRGAATPQEVDEGRANVEVAEATVNAARAEVGAKKAAVERLSQLQSFQHVAAPFTGVITARNVDPGALIGAGGGSNGSRELFRIAQTDTLRVFVNVPQSYVASIRIGQEAQILVREFARRKFTGKVARTAGAIDPSSRTLLTEVQVDNKDQALFSGMYVQVQFSITSQDPVLMVPTNTLLVNAEGTRVAVLRDRKVVNYRKVVVGRDLGPEAEIIEGLSGDELLAANPGDLLPEGMAVQVAENAKGPS